MYNILEACISEGVDVPKQVSDYFDLQSEDWKDYGSIENITLDGIQTYFDTFSHIEFFKHEYDSNIYKEVYTIDLEKIPTKYKKLKVYFG
jgi:hypothetical protein